MFHKRMYTDGNQAHKKDVQHWILVKTATMRQHYTPVRAVKEMDTGKSGESV